MSYVTRKGDANGDDAADQECGVLVVGLLWDQCADGADAAADRAVC